MEKLISKFNYGKHTVTIESGEIARQATASVMVDMDGTTVLVTLVAAKEAKPDQSFFPLTVVYQEKFYAGGRIPGGFLKREGRPSENETLTSRLIDRPIRPLFPEGFMNEVQIIATVMSINPEVSADIPAMIGTSAALALSGVPFHGPIGAARVGYINGEFVLNPSSTELKGSDLDLVVAGTESAVLMVESEANMLPEDTMLEAVWYGHEQMQCVIDAVSALAEQAKVTPWTFTPPEQNKSLLEKVQGQFGEHIASAYQIADKTERRNVLNELRQKAVETLAPAEQTEIAADDVIEIFESIEKTTVRQRILDGKPRIDGRDTRTVRPIAVRMRPLQRPHGSVLFTRGETQAIVVATLGSARDAQLIDSAEGESRDQFLLHYNFPPYSVGETGQIGSPKRREIGHGRLARRGIQAVLPSQEEFPYVLRVVSEITESNGSSSMASVCGSSLALMDAGVPVKAPVAGIAMGLVLEENKFAVLTDILGDEDHLGDMDFKVAGTENGVTALQMDIKIQGITKFIMHKALEQAKVARLHILNIMNQALSEPRKDVSEHAPRLITINVKPDKIRDIIGKGGATIRALTEETGASIDIDDKGVVSIFALDAKAGEAAQQRIEEIVADVEVGQIYEGPITKLLDFGAIVSLIPGREGLVHISQIKDERVENINDVLKEGETVKVKVLEIDRQGRVRLSMKPEYFEEK